MSTTPEFGLYHLWENLQSLIPTTAEMSTGGLVVTAPDKAGGIEYHTPYRVNAMDADFYTSLGAAGTAQDALDAINGNIETTAADVVITVAPEGTSADPDTKILETVASLAGDQALQTGIHALRRAPQLLEVTPRLISVPGYTSQASLPTDTNAVVAGLPGLLGALTATAFIDGPNSTKGDATGWYETLPASERLVPIETAIYVGTGQDRVLAPTSARAVGMQIRVDTEKGGFPFHSIANRDVWDATAPGREMEFLLNEGATEGQQILAAGMGVVVRGALGVDAAPADNGIRLIVTDTTSDDKERELYNVQRGRDWIEITNLKTLRAFLGQYNLTGHVMVAYARTVEKILRKVKNEGHIAGFEVDIPVDRNAVEDLAQGELTVAFKAQPFPVFKRGRLIHSPYRASLTTTLEEARQRLNDGLALAGSGRPF